METEIPVKGSQCPDSKAKYIRRSSLRNEEDLGLEETLNFKDMGNRLVWYSHVDPERTVSVVNEVKTRVQNGEQIFYDIYTDEEKNQDPSRKDTGLFYFRGNHGEKFAVVNAGGGFMYVAAMHDGFPQMSY